MKTDKYLNVDFEKGGSLTHANGNPIWVQFVRDFRSDLKRMLKGSGMELFLHNNHYFLSGFLFDDLENKWFYFSTSDVRYFPNEWHNSVLVRTAKNANDYSGGVNNFCKFSELVETAVYLREKSFFLLTKN